MLSLYYDELIGTIEEYGGKKYLMVDDHTLGRVLNKIKRIGIEKLDDIRILIQIDKLPDDTILKTTVISMICVIKDSDKFYP